MAKYKVVEYFVSVNGEGTRSGELAVFVRFAGCNLRCSYCDTQWANREDVAYQWMTEHEIYQRIQETGVHNVTLTGGEPLLQKDILVLIKLLARDKELSVEIETNGSVDLEPFAEMEQAPLFTMDYKLAGSGMEAQMRKSNFALLAPKDTVKFVIGCQEDLARAKDIVEEYGLLGRCHVYFSPVYGRIELADMVTYMIENRLNGVVLQMQLHKVIWDPQARGV